MRKLIISLVTAAAITAAAPALAQTAPGPRRPRPTPRPSSGTRMAAAAATTAAETQPGHHHRMALICHAGTAARPVPGALGAPTGPARKIPRPAPWRSAPASEHPPGP